LARTGSPATRHLAAVERATAVLDALGTTTADMGTNELARATGINASTVSRLLATLAAAGYVEHVADTGRYRLGTRLVQLSQAVLARLDVRQVARPQLEALVEQTGETATLSLPSDHDAITADFVPGRASVISVARVGRPSIPHCTAVGKVMLAFGRHGTDALAETLIPFTPRTITDRARLDTELDAVRRDGVATAVGERESDLNAIAAPVFDARGLAGIIGLQGPAGRFDGAALEAAAEPLREAAHAATLALGGPRR
jgi:IclR family acetate operon transcriptional repressor